MDLRLDGDVQSVDNTGEISEDREEDVDEEISAAAALKADSERREEDGEDDLADVAVICYWSVQMDLCVSTSVPVSR